MKKGKNTQIAELADDFVRRLHRDYSAQGIDRLHAQRAVLLGRIAGAMNDLVQPIPTLPAVHANIRVPAEVDGWKYLICGFLGKGEKSVSGPEMFRRTEIAGTRPCDDGDWCHLERSGDRFPFPMELSDHHFVTGRSELERADRLTLLAWQEDKRRTFWVGRNVEYGAIALVIRRVVAE